MRSKFLSWNQDLKASPCIERVRFSNHYHYNSLTRPPTSISAAQVKVYIYNLPKVLSGIVQNSSRHENRRFEVVLPELLRAYKLQTYNPVALLVCLQFNCLMLILHFAKNEADFFYIPAHLCHFFVEKRDSALFSTCAKCAQLDKDIIEFLRSVGPYFDRHNGADHLVRNIVM